MAQRLENLVEALTLMINGNVTELAPPYPGAIYINGIYSNPESYMKKQAIEGLIAVCAPTSLRPHVNRFIQLIRHWDRGVRIVAVDAVKYTHQRTNAQDVSYAQALEHVLNMEELSENVNNEEDVDRERFEKIMAIQGLLEVDSFDAVTPCADRLIQLTQHRDVGGVLQNTIEALKHTQQLTDDQMGSLFNMMLHAPDMHLPTYSNSIDRGTRAGIALEILGGRGLRSRWYLKILIDALVEQVTRPGNAPQAAAKAISKVLHAIATEPVGFNGFDLLSVRRLEDIIDSKHNYDVRGQACYVFNDLAVRMYIDNDNALTNLGRLFYGSGGQDGVSGFLSYMVQRETREVMLHSASGHLYHGGDPVENVMDYLNCRISPDRMQKAKQQCSFICVAMEALYTLRVNEELDDENVIPELNVLYEEVTKWIKRFDEILDNDRERFYQLGTYMQNPLTTVWATLQHVLGLFFEENEEVNEEVNEDENESTRS